MKITSLFETMADKVCLLSLSCINKGGSQAQQGKGARILRHQRWYMVA